VQTRVVERRAGEHVAHFYAHDSELVVSAGSHLSTALRAGGVAVAIATRPHREGFEAYLARDGVELGQARAEGRLVLLDANATLYACMSDGEIDRRAFHRVIGGLLREAQELGGAVHAYGEMVALLWDAANVTAAIELETLWNELADELDFSLLCAYPTASSTGGVGEHALHAVCSLHSAVLGRPGGDELDKADRRSTHRLTASFPAAPHSPGEARRLLVHTLDELACEAGAVDTAALVLSELASNAVRHARSPFTIDVAMHASSMRLAVRDACPPGAGESLIVLPTHGLGVIDALATRWGVERVPDGKVVWAELQI
jgi:MEDS: MEthanogen/methylotroph, DcmR Sensory domain